MRRGQNDQAQQAYQRNYLNKQQYYITNIIMNENRYQLEADFNTIIEEEIKAIQQNKKYLVGERKKRLLKVCVFDYPTYKFCKYYNFEVDLFLTFQNHVFWIYIQNGSHQQYVKTTDCVKNMLSKFLNQNTTIQQPNYNNNNEQIINSNQNDIVDTRYYQYLEDITDDEDLKMHETYLHKLNPENEKLVKEIFNKYIKHHNKKVNFVKDFKYYLDNDQELILEYFQPDNSKDINFQIKRIKFSKLLNKAVQHFQTHQIKALIESMLSEIFIIHEIIQSKQLNVMNQIINHLHQTDTYDKVVMNRRIDQPKLKKLQKWNVYFVKPQSLQDQDTYENYKFLLIQDNCEIFFLNHTAIYYLFDNEWQRFFSSQYLKHQYQAFQNTVESSSRNIEDEWESLCNDEPQAQEFKSTRYLNNIKEELSEFYDLKFHHQDLIQFEEELDGFNNQKKEYLNTNQDELNRFNLDSLERQINEAEKRIYQIKQINIEYQKVLEPVKIQLIQYQNVQLDQKEKESLKQLQLKLLIESQRCHQKLPIYTRKSELIDLVNKNQVVLLIGETGSGKSTQLVQYLAENILLEGKQIICTQPRVLAAKSLAKRVAEELKTTIGEFVGIDLGTDIRVSDQTKIIFSQDRILLNQLAEDPMLSKYKIIVVDEAHERTTNTDILLGLLQQLCLKRKDLRIVVTSATMDEELFANYFRAPIFKVEGRLYRVEVIYEPYSYIELQVDRATKFVEEKIVQKILNKTYDQKHVLIFMTGVDEVETMMNRFSRFQNHQLMHFLPLHGMLTNEEQFEVFRERDNVTKIIFSTRISETALTINDISIVVDLGYDRFQQFDQDRGMTLTTIDIISQSQANQRKGRAGRTGPGICYRLYSEDQWIYMTEFKQSEMQRMSLDIVVLRLKQFDVSDVTTFNYIEKPDPRSLLISEEYLQNIKALRLQNGQRTITELGKLMAQLSTEPRISRILIQSFYQNCNKEVLSIVSVLANSQFLFIRGDDQSKTQHIWNRLSFFDSEGDLLTFLNVYNDWQEQNYKCGGRNEQLKRWCRENSLHYKALKQSESTRNELQNVFHHWKNKLINDDSIQREISGSQYLIDQDVYEEEDFQKKKTNIINCFLTAYFPDLCIFNGDYRMGYTLLQKQMNVKIYATSSIGIQNSYPKWILCSDLLYSQISQNTLCRVAQEVSYEMLEKYLPKDFFEKFQIKELNNKQSPNYNVVERQNLAKPLINSLKQYFYQNKKDHEQDIIDFETNNFRILTCVNKNDVEVFFDSKIQEFRKKADQERCIKVFGHGVQCFFGKGGKLENIHPDLNNSVSSVTFRNSSINKDQIQDILDKKLIKYLGIFETQMDYCNNSGMIYFDTTELAQHAIRLLEQDSLFNDNKFRDQSVFRVESRNVQDSFVTCDIEITFYLAKGTGKGFFQYEKTEDGIEAASKLETENFIHNITLDGQLLKIKRTHKRHSFILEDLDDNLDEKQLEDVISDFCNIFQLQKPIFYVIFREEVMTSKNSQQKVYWESQIDAILKSLKNKNKLQYKYRNLKKSKKQNEQIKVVVDIRKNQDFLEVQKLIQLNHRKTGVLGEQCCYFKVTYSNYKPFPSKSYTILQKEFNEVKTIANNKFSDVKVNFDSSEDKKQIAMRINCNNPLKVSQVANLFNPLVNGKQYSSPEVQAFFKMMRNNQFKKQINNLESDNQCFVFTTGLKYVRVYGKTYKSIDQCIEKLDHLIKREAVEQFEIEKRIDLRGWSLKPMLISRDNLLSKLKNDHPEVEQQLDLINKSLILWGRKDHIELIQKELFMKLKKSTILTNNVQQQCQICISDLDEKKFSLILCSHTYCYDCLVQYCMDSISNRKLPLKCPNDTCEEFISISDIKSIIGRESFDDLLNMSYKTYLSNNTQNYVQCITEDCDQIFPNKEDIQFLHCECCFNQFCSACNQGIHLNQTCEQYSADLKNQENLTKEQQEELGIKLCPKCKNGVQKNTGCNHIECQKCKIHFCWVCLYVSETPKPIYDHMYKDHQNE